MNAYSEDLRKKIVEAVESGMPKIEAARSFGGGISSLKRYVATYREGRSLTPKKRPGSKQKLDGGARKLLEANLEDHLEVTLSRGVSSCGAYVEFRSATPRFPGCSDAWVGAEKKINGCERERRVAEGSLACSGGRGSGGEAAGVRGRDGYEHLAGIPVCLVQTGRTGACERAAQLGSERHLIPL